MTAPNPKVRSGPYLPEDERNTVAIKLRLPPVVAERLRAIAHAWRCPMGAVIEPALIALEKSAREVLRGGGEE